MSTSILPALPGLSWPQGRSMLWSTTVTESVSGKETTVAHWTYPRWQWELTWGLLRTLSGTTELQTFVNFCLARGGRADTWLYQDSDDNAVTGQLLGVGDGVTRTFQLVRSFGGLGGFVEPIWAPNQVTAVTLGGVVQAGSAWSVTGWGSAAPGVITFVTPPPAGAVVAASFSYFFACRFLKDQIDMSKFMSGRYKAEKIAFYSIK